jgi:endonuclease YncB( thermonuclease family)
MEYTTYKNLEVIDTHDGDTTTLKIDVFINKTFYIGPCRLLGIDTPEIDDPNIGIRAKAIEAREYLKKILRYNKPLEVTAKTDDKYGRPLVIIMATRNKQLFNINQEMLDLGFGKKIGLAAQRKSKPPKDIEGLGKLLFAAHEVEAEIIRLRKKA